MLNPVYNTANYWQWINLCLSVWLLLDESCHKAYKRQCKILTGAIEKLFLKPEDRKKAEQIKSEWEEFHWFAILATRHNPLNPYAMTHRNAVKALLHLRNVDGIKAQLKTKYGDLPDIINFIDLPLNLDSGQFDDINLDPMNFDLAPV